MDIDQPPVEEVRVEYQTIRIERNFDRHLEWIFIEVLCYSPVKRGLTEVSVANNVATLRQPEGNGSAGIWGEWKLTLGARHEIPKVEIARGKRHDGRQRQAREAYFSEFINDKVMIP